MMAPASVTIIGAFPPPVHGFALINAELGRRLNTLVDTVRLLPTSPRTRRRLPYFADKLGRCGAVLLGLATARTAPTTVVIGLDGDAGLWLNLCQARLAHHLGYRLFLYHHSARSLAASHLAMRAIVAIGPRNVVHVMCSASMADRFRDLYGWRGAIRVVPNLAYVEPASALQARRLPAASVTLGFLSNLMRSKGALLVVDVLRELLHRGIDARLLMAGPFVEPDVEAELKTAEREFSGRLQLLGRVDADAKAQFFAAADVFLFPTLYPHETQSLVVPEAMAAGVPVIAHAHNFVAETLPPGWPGLISPKSGFVGKAAGLIIQWLTEPAVYTDLSAMALAQFGAMKLAADGQLADLLDELREARP